MGQEMLLGHSCIMGVTHGILLDGKTLGEPVNSRWTNIIYPRILSHYGESTTPRSFGQQSQSRYVYALLKLMSNIRVTVQSSSTSTSSTLVSIPHLKILPELVGASRPNRGDNDTNLKRYVEEFT